MMSNYLGRKQYEEEFNLHSSICNEEYGIANQNMNYNSENIYLTKKQQSFNEVQNYGNFLEKVSKQSTINA